MREVFPQTCCGPSLGLPLQALPLLALALDFCLCGVRKAMRGRELVRPARHASAPEAGVHASAARLNGLRSVSTVHQVDRAECIDRTRRIHASLVVQRHVQVGLEGVGIRYAPLHLGQARDAVLKLRRAGGECKV